MIKNVASVCEKTISERIKAASDMLASASECLASRNYFQAAVRLKGLEEFGRFTEFELEIIDAASES